MVELNRPKAYLTYYADQCVKDLLLTKFENCGLIIKVGGKSVRCTREIPKSIEQDLITRYNATITSSDDVRYRGKKKLFGISLSKSKIIILNKEKYVQVRIIADTVEELFQKISVLKQELYTHGIKEKMCVWDRLGKITVDYEQPKPGKKPDFDPEVAQKQRTLDLEFYRETYKGY